MAAQNAIFDTKSLRRIPAHYADQTLRLSRDLHQNLPTTVKSQPNPTPARNVQMAATSPIRLNGVSTIDWRARASGFLQCGMRVSWLAEVGASYHGGV